MNTTSIVDGDSLNVAVRNGSVWAEAGAVFAGKSIETVPDVPMFRMRLVGVARFYAPTDIADNVYRLTGRRIWSIAGKGYAYECKAKNGQVIWASGLRPTSACQD